MQQSSQIIPQHIAIIPDGNRRWAKERGVSTLQGHKRGVEVFEAVGRAALDRGVRYMTYFGFSTENWKRSKHEVGYLMKLFRWLLTDRLDEFHRENVRINVIGRVDAFSKDLQKLIAHAVELTRHNTKGVINLALNYGGRDEIVDIVRKALVMKLDPAAVTEQSVAQLAYAPDIPDPDLVIRTSGEQRLSGFLTWESVYSELFFPQKYWPDFTEKDLDSAIDEFTRRERRFGK